MGKILTSLLSTTDGLITVLSPIAAIFYVLGAVLLFAELTDHAGRITTLADEGKLAVAIVESIELDGDVRIKFEDNENSVRYASIEKKMYAVETMDGLVVESNHLVRYDPLYRYDPALEDHWSEFINYRSRIDGLLFLLGISFIILVIRPDILYIGYVPDWTALYHRDFPVSVSEEQV